MDCRMKSLSETNSVSTATSRSFDQEVDASAADPDPRKLGRVGASDLSPKVIDVVITEPQLEPAHFMYFTNLPSELIEKIYVYSGNFSLPLTNRFLHGFLNHRVVRLHFCSRIFGQRPKHYDPRCELPIAAPGQHENEVVELQTTLFRQTWFDAEFTRLLESTTPLLQALAKERKETDARASGGVRPRGCSSRLMYSRGPRMPQTLFCGQWTDDKAELFHRLRSWWVEPDVRDLTLLASRPRRAGDDGRDNIAAELRWYVEAAEDMRRVAEKQKTSYWKCKVGIFGTPQS